MDIETMGQIDPSRTSYVNQNQFLAFAVVSLDNKDKTLPSSQCNLAAAQCALHCYPKQ